jgi:hypothetical protein
VGARGRPSGRDVIRAPDCVTCTRSVSTFLVAAAQSSVLLVGTYLTQDVPSLLSEVEAACIGSGAAVRARCGRERQRASV